MSELPAGLAAWAQQPGPAKVLEAIRLRARRGHNTERGSLSTVDLSAGERRQVGRLVGADWELSGQPVQLRALTGALAQHGLTVREFVECVYGGPIEENSAVRARAAAAAATERQHAAEQLTAAGVDQSTVDLWLADPVLPRAGTGELIDLTEQVAHTWKRLPHNNNPEPLAQIAAEVRHDSHALDSDSLLGRAVARLAATAHRLPRPQRAGRTWRDAWASVGVRCDSVSSRVLALNLPLTGTAAAARLCRAASGEPVWLTLRSLAADWSAPAEVTIFVCENVTVVEAAADMLGDQCPPLVATDGIASGAALDLLAGLGKAGSAIRARADFDPSGFVVVDQVLSVAPHAVLWRFDVNSYRQAAGITEKAGTEATDLANASPADAVTRLREVYTMVGAPVHEERLLDQLLHDLQVCEDHLRRPHDQRPR